MNLTYNYHELLQQIKHLPEHSASFQGQKIVLVLFVKGMKIGYQCVSLGHLVRLLHILESLSPADHKKMLDVAEVTLDTLHRMSIDYEPFSEVVKEFIHCSSKLAEFEGSVDKELCSQELIDIYGGKKARYENASHLHKEALGALKTSENHLKSLGEEVSHVKGMLCELEKQVFSCETETLELQDQVAVRYEEMVEAEGSMEAACKVMEEALELEQQRETTMQAAQAALERARRVIKFI